MAYDISVMRTGYDGMIDYRFPSLNERIVGKEKLVQHYIKYLYDDNIGGLLKTIRTKKSWSDDDVRMSLMAAYRHVEAMQAGKNMPPEERMVGMRIDGIQIQKELGKLRIVVTLKTQSGTATLEL